MDLENLDTNNLPDIKQLEQLANHLFKSAPTSIPQTNGVQESFQDSANDNANIDKVKANLNDNSTLGINSIPKSFAGSGKSPSLTDHQNNFKVSDPQTSLLDPHFYNGEIPKSVAGNGKSPSLQDAGSGAGANSAQAENFSFDKLPLAEEQDYEKQLKEVLNSITSYFPTSQLTNITPFSTGDASYYFLNGHAGSNQAQSLLNIQGNNTHNTHGITSMVRPPFDLNILRADFPILKERVNGKPLVWLDNAATTQKPLQVIERVNYFYNHENSNIHRAAHELAARSTDAYEAARKKIQHFLNARSPNEIVFVRGTTEAINLVAQSWGDQNLNAGDEIVLTHLEHHANIVPWQLIAAKKGAKIRVAPVDDNGQIILSEYGKLLNSKTKLVAFTQVSNALGTITPAKAMIEMAHAVGAKVLLDGAQSVSHIRTDLQSLNPDWFVFSGHKIYGPTGIGVLYGKEDLLNEMQPWQGGGNMIQDVTFEESKFQPAPGKFEAGTGNIADAVGLGAAIDYVSKVGIDLIYQYEHALLHYATHLLKDVPGLHLIGTAPEKTSVLSFILDGYKNDEVGQALNKEGIAVRTGHHCAQPILRRF
ncbi:MAG TPA: family 2A encapsulin nanocompartment cargo protein cysteine desulfurase, partial [Bacteroidia bacterium]|nr:family 2A encapsulin nanocompartment cargo protein cysteine desulfurase [Bacteroidia bacterium]